jgi:hypothetical protein
VSQGEWFLMFHVDNTPSKCWEITYPMTWQHIPEDLKPLKCCCEKFKSWVYYMHTDRLGCQSKNKDFMMKGPTFMPEEDIFWHSITQYLFLQNLKNYLL